MPRDCRFSGVQHPRRPRAGASKLLLYCMCACCVTRAGASVTRGSAASSVGAQIDSAGSCLCGHPNWRYHCTPHLALSAQDAGMHHCPSKIALRLRGGSSSIGNNATEEMKGRASFIGSEWREKAGGGQGNVHAANTTGDTGQQVPVHGGGGGENQEAPAHQRRAGVGAGHVAPLRVAPGACAE
jgi:hypothetical protein